MNRSARAIRSWVAKAAVYDVLTLALQMEKGAARLYSLLARRAANPLSRAKFRYLVQEEREHARMLAAAMRGHPKSLPLHKPPAALSESAGRPDADTPHAALRLALASERDSERFYRACAARCRRPAARAMFLHLAAQESRHALAVQDELALLGGLYAWSSIEGAPPAENDYWLVRPE